MNPIYLIIQLTFISALSSSTGCYEYVEVPCDSNTYNGSTVNNSTLTNTTQSSQNVNNVTNTSDVFTDNSFVTQWTISDDDLNITLPLIDTGTYNFIVDWGDGTNADTVQHYNAIEATHTYPGNGSSTYTINITGVFEGLWFPDSSRLKIVDVLQWGNMSLGDLV